MLEVKSKEELIRIIGNFERLYEADKERITELKLALDDLTSLCNKKPMYFEWNIFPGKIPSLHQNIVYIKEINQFDSYGINFVYDEISEIYYLSEDGEEEIEFDHYDNEKGFDLQLIGHKLQTSSQYKLYWMDSLVFQLKMAKFLED